VVTVAPILFKLGPIAVHGYGLMVAIGLLVCYPVLASDARRKGLDRLAGELASLYLWMLAAGYVGGKLFYVWTSPAEFEHVKATKGFLATLGNGFVFYGSLIACLPTLWWWLRRRKLPVLASIDTVILAAPIMLGLGRVGCFLSGCCHGCRTSSFLAVEFDHGQGLNHVPIHPAQLYETAGCAIVFAILWFRTRHRAPWPGFVTAVYLVLYAIERYVVELFRGDVVRGYLVGGGDLAPGDPPGFALSFSQGVSIVAVAAGALWLRKGSKLARRRAAARPRGRTGEFPARR
jgi:phosphatidylglycerol:prolipoprotein diacylglycerol transferase